LKIYAESVVHWRCKKKLISILVPFRADSPYRVELWSWLREYWEHELPEAEIIIGHDHGARKGEPFSKTSAVNNAFHRSRGDIIVILDADAYMDGEVIKHCAHRLRQARRHGRRTWFIPYRYMYRLTQEATFRVLSSDPFHPLRFPTPPNPGDIDGTQGSAGPGRAHNYGALIQIMPREAFETVGCMDPRFRGWGGEDVSFLRALDTLWGRHKNMDEEVLHLWHPKKHIGGFDPASQYLTRVWNHQRRPGSNNKLAMRYHLATWKPVQMRKLVDEGCRSAHRRRVREWVLDLWVGND
jgi:glycosyltransferase involved in cell wall biosynthesis